MIAGGIALCFVPGAQVFGAALIVTGAGGLIGGGISAANGGDFGSGWNVGTAIGAAIGLAIVAPQVIGMTANLTLPTGFGWIATSAGTLVLGVTSTATLVIPVGAIAIGTGALALSGYMYYEGKKVAPRINNNTKKGAYDGAFQKGGKNPPRGPENHGHGWHYHPNVPSSHKFSHWHYYWKKSSIIILGLGGILEKLFGDKR